MTYRPLRYYNGEHDVLQKEKSLRPEMHSLLADLKVNYCELVVDMIAERCEVQGFRLGDNIESDDLGQKIWHGNDMDEQTTGGQPLVIAAGHGAISVWFDAKGEAEMCFESSDEVIVETDPANRSRSLAALKSWTDEWGIEQATLYLPDFIYRMQRNRDRSSMMDPVIYGLDGTFTSPSGLMVVSGWPGGGDGGSGTADWVPRKGVPWAVRNPLGEVPVYPLSNRASTTRPGKSEIVDMLGMQDAANLLTVDLVVAADFGAFMQKWATGLEIDTDENGQDVSPFHPDIDRILQSENEETKFGQFLATPLSNYVDGLQQIAVQIAHVKRIPGHYLLSMKGQWPTGDAVRTAEMGLVFRAKRCQRSWGRPYKNAMRAAYRIAGDGRDTSTLSTMWNDPVTKSESERADALVKRAAIGVPFRQLWLDAGYTERQCNQFEEWLMDVKKRTIVAQALAQIAMAQSSKPTDGQSGSSSNASDGGTPTGGSS